MRTVEEVRKKIFTTIFQNGIILNPPENRVEEILRQALEDMKEECAKKAEIFLTGVSSPPQTGNHIRSIKIL